MFSHLYFMYKRLGRLVFTLLLAATKSDIRALLTPAPTAEQRRGDIRLDVNISSVKTDSNSMIKCLQENIEI